MEQVEKCLLCGSTDIKNIPDQRDVAHWRCSNCMEVLISRTATVTMQKFSTDFWLLSAYFRQQSKNKLPIEMLHTNNIEELINKVKKPKNIFEAESRIIEFLGDNTETLGSYTNYHPYMFLDLVIPKQELDYLIFNLSEQDYIESYPDIHLVGHDQYRIGDIRLTSDGWNYYHKIKTEPIESNNVFIAMWFNEKTEKLRESIKAAVLSAGYDPIIVDERHFTGNIMDYIIGQIKQSKFLISDFTVTSEDQTKIENNDELKNTPQRKGTRGGVYYEAGFAKGLGLEVINMCKNDNFSKNRLHFDIIQDNTLFWEDVDVENNVIRQADERKKSTSPINLSEKLFDRIISIFGYGVNKKI